MLNVPEPALQQHMLCTRAEALLMLLVDAGSGQTKGEVAGW